MERRLGKINSTAQTGRAQPEQEPGRWGLTAQLNWDEEHISALKELLQSLTGQAGLQCTRHPIQAPGTRHYTYREDPQWLTIHLR